MRVREGYRIWHDPTFADDALQAPLDTQWWGGWSMGSTTDSTYAPYQHIPGLAVGGWYDPGNDDLDTASNLDVIQDLALASKELGISYDSLMVDPAASFVELHRTDGSNDLQQQVKQGILQTLGQIDNVGFVFKGLKVPTLKQATQMGDASKNSDGLVYDSSLASGDTNGLKSGKLDDRLAFVGTKDVALQFDAAAALASASYVLGGSTTLWPPAAWTAAQHIWDTETIATSGPKVAAQTAAKWNAAVQLLIATHGSKDAYKQFLEDAAAAELTTARFGVDGWKAVRILKYMDPAFNTSFRDALADYLPVVDSRDLGQPVRRAGRRRQRRRARPGSQHEHPPQVSPARREHEIRAQRRELHPGHPHVQQHLLGLRGGHQVGEPRFRQQPSRPLLHRGWRRRRRRERPAGLPRSRRRLQLPAGRERLQHRQRRQVGRSRRCADVELAARHHRADDDGDALAADARRPQRLVPRAGAGDADARPTRRSGVGVDAATRSTAAPSTDVHGAVHDLGGRLAHGAVLRRPTRRERRGDAVDHRQGRPERPGHDGDADARDPQRLVRVADADADRRRRHRLGHRAHRLRARRRRRGRPYTGPLSGFSTGNHFVAVPRRPTTPAASRR